MGQTVVNIRNNFFKKGGKIQIKQQQKYKKWYEEKLNSLDCNSFQGLYIGLL